MNEPQIDADLAAIRRSIEGGRPFGSDEWTEQIIRRHGLEITSALAEGPERQTKVPDTFSTFSSSVHCGRKSPQGHRFAIHCLMDRMIARAYMPDDQE